MILYCRCNRSFQYHPHTGRFMDLDTGITVSVCQCARDLVPLEMATEPIDHEALDAAGVAAITHDDRGAGYTPGVTIGRGERQRRKHVEY